MVIYVFYLHYFIYLRKGFSAIYLLLVIAAYYYIGFPANYLAVYSD